MGLSHSPLPHAGGDPGALPYPANPSGGGLGLCRQAATRASPQHIAGNVVTQCKLIGIGADTALKASFWHATVDEGPQASDADFINVSMHTGGGRAWRNHDAQPTGAVVMLPFEGAYWYFEQPVSFVQFHLPFALAAGVGEALFGRELRHADLCMPADVGDARLQELLQTLQAGLVSATPTNLLLDSWALILADRLLRSLSNRGAGRARGAFGRIPQHHIARVVDYIEAGIDQNLRLSSLAAVAGMSVYHFARSFKETVGLSPHAYVLSRRIMRASAMLACGPESLAAIAFACGFSSQAHLTTVFRARFGITPGEYRSRSSG